jgi:AcrR family transcriptional regulator
METQQPKSTGVAAQVRTQKARQEGARKPRKAEGTLRRQRPRGREAIMTAVLDAATTLFATRGPASVSVRDIAAAAGVNHALVHRHFGTKQEVLRAVLERTVQEIAAATNEIADSGVSLRQRFKFVAEHEDYWRVLARAILDNENPRTLQRDFPNARRMIALLQAEQQQPRSRQERAVPHAPVDARIVVGAVSALTMGWLLFEPFLLVATGLDEEDREEVRGQVIHMLQTIIELTP